MKNSGLIKRFAPYYKKYVWVLVLDLLCAGLTTICELVLPIIIRNITNNVASLTVEYVLRVGALYIILRIIDAAANYFMASVGHIMGAKIETDMRRDIFAHLMRLSHSYYDDVKTGQIMARITSDLFDVTEFAHHCPEEFFIAGVKIAVSFVILARTNLLLTLIIFIMIPLMVIFSSYFQRKMRRAFKESRNQIGELNAQVEDSLLGIRVVKSFANEGIEKDKFAKGNGRFLDIKRDMYKAMAGFHTTTRAFDGIMYIVVVIVGALLMIYGKINSGDYIAFLLYVSTLLTSVRRIVEFAEQFQRGMTGIERFEEVMDAPVEICDLPNAKTLENPKGHIVFENVSFKYETGGDVLSGINLDVKPGSNVALVGSSGAGKTTMCNLISRFYEPYDGRILLDGNDIKDYTLFSLRSNIGIVQQDVYLFSGTIAENIGYGCPGASREEIVRAAELAGADEFVEALPNGYDTFVGERGVKLSGGQKQRISIARVFLKNPPVLILDEATSALDTESEALIQKSLRELTKGRTTFTIAHRLTTIRNAGLILVLTEDGIAESGSHRELMEKQGLYYKLYSVGRDAGEQI